MSLDNIYAESAPKTTIVTDKLLPGLSVYLDVGGECYSLDATKLVYRLGREGITIRVLLYAGKVYMASSHKVDSASMRLANGLTVEETFKALGGNVDELFDLTKQYSLYSHTFILSPRDMLIASKINMIDSDGHLYYLGHNQLWNLEQTKWDPQHVDTELRKPSILEMDWVPLDVANHHLKYGYHPDESSHISVDPRLRPGEFVIALDPETNKWYRIESFSYHWRLRIREKESHLRYGFYKHLTLALKAIKARKKSTTAEEYRAYVALFPSMPYVEPRSIETAVRCKGYIVTWPSARSASEKHLVYNTWACYLMACPLHLQMEASGFYNDYYETCRNCAQKIYAIWRGALEFNENRISNNMDAIAINRIKDIIRQSQLRGGNQSHNPNEIKQNCINLINKERGGSLFAISEFFAKYSK